MYRIWMKGIMAACLVCACFWVAPAAWAEPLASEGEGTPSSGSDESALQMPAVVVTATRAARDLKEIPLSVSVVGQEEMERNAQITIADQIANIPGVQLSGANIAGDRRVMLRGQPAGNTLILIDGIRQPEIRNTAGAGFTIDTNDIERIEVIKGPASVLYGSDAIGGVINIITKKGGLKPFGFRVGGIYDSSTDGFEPSASVFGSYKGFFYRVSGSGIEANDRRGADGDRIYNSSYKQQNYRGKLGYEWDKGEFLFSADKFKGENNYTPVSATGDGGYEPAPPDKRATISEVPQNDREAYTATFTVRDIADFWNQIKTTAYWQKLDKRFDYYNYTTGIYSGKHKYEHEAYGGSVQSDWTFFDDHFVSLGVEFDHITMDKWDYYPTSGSSAKTEGKQQMFAVFLQDEWTIAPSLVLTAGLRQTWTKTEMSKNTSAPEKEDRSSDRNLVGSVGLVYSGIENTALRALFSQGYKTPNLTQLFVGSGVIIPNPELKPEKSNNFEIGVRYDNGIIHTDLALFHSRFKNGIAYETVDPDASRLTYNTKNIDKVKSFGLEWALDITIPDTGLTPYGTLNLLRYETENADGFKTKHTSRPTVWGTLGLRWEGNIFADATLYLDANTVMSEGAYTRNADGTKKDKTGSWQTANFTAGIRGGEEHKYNVALSLRNIFDEDYQIAAPFSPSSPLPEPGFHTVLSFSYEF